MSPSGPIREEGGVAWKDWRYGGVCCKAEALGADLRGVVIVDIDSRWVSFLLF